MKPKILLIIPNYGFGGAQRVFSDHSKLLSEDFEVHECVFNLEVEQAYQTGNTIHSLNVAAGSNGIMKFVRFIQRISRLKKLKKQLSIDITISHLEGADYVNVLSRKSDKIFCVIHGSKIADENIAGFIGFLRHRILMPILYNKADHIITVSKGIKNELLTRYNLSTNNITPIPNFFDIQFIQQKSNEPCLNELIQLKQSYKLVLYSGRFAAQKNLYPLIEIFSYIKQLRSDVKLILVGDGELKNELIQKCSYYHLSYTENNDFTKDVIFLGYQPNPFPIIKSCDLFVMTSKWEGFPMALCEALAIGANVVVSDCPTGPQEIINGIENEFKHLFIGNVLPIPIEQNDQLIKIWVDEINEILNRGKESESDKIKRIEYIRKYDKSEVSKEWLRVING